MTGIHCTIDHLSRLYALWCLNLAMLASRSAKLRKTPHRRNLDLHNSDTEYLMRVVLIN